MMADLESQNSDVACHKRLMYIVFGRITDPFWEIHNGKITKKKKLMPYAGINMVVM